MPIPYAGITCEKCFEVYSGNTDPAVTGGVDKTPEFVEKNIRNDAEWSIMMAGTADDTRDFTPTVAKYPVFAFSIEELSTIDFEDIPSRSGD